MKKAWQVLVKNWLTISYWICVGCFFINVVLIEIDLHLGLQSAAQFQMGVAGVCFAGALIQYLRSLPDGPPDEE